MAVNPTWDESEAIAPTWEASEPVTPTWEESAPIEDEEEQTRLRSEALQKAQAREILSIPKPVEGDMDDESQSKMVYGLLMEKQFGRKLSDSELKAQLANEFGDGATYTQARKDLLAVHSIEPGGGDPNPVTMSESAQATLGEKIKFSGQGIMGLMAQNLSSAVSGMMRVDAGTVAEKILPVTGPVGQAVSLAMKAAGVDVGEAIDKPFEKAIAFKREVASEIEKRGGAAKDFWETGVPESVKQSFGYQAVTGLGEIPMLALYAIPPVGVAVTASRYLDEGYSEAQAAGKNEQQSQDIALGYAALFAPLGVLVDKFTLGIGKGAKPVAGSIGKAILKQTGKVAVESQIAGVGELITETAESAGLQAMTKGEVNWKQAFTEGAMAYISGVAGGSIMGTAQIGDYAASVKRVKDLGVTESEAVALVDRMQTATTPEEQQAVSEEIALKTLENVGKVEKVIDEAVNPFSVDEEISAVEQQISALDAAPAEGVTIQDQDILNNENTQKIAETEQEQAEDGAEQGGVIPAILAAKENEAVYIRVSLGADIDLKDENYVSDNLKNGGKEEGMSAWALTGKDSQKAFTDLPDNHPANIGARLSENADMLFDSSGKRNENKMWVVNGNLSGYGMDGEPLLKNAEYVTDVDFESIRFYVLAWAKEYETRNPDAKGILSRWAEKLNQPDQRPALESRLEQLKELKARQDFTMPTDPIVLLDTPQTAGQLKSWIQHVVGGEQALREVVDPERAEQILAAAGGDKDALTALNQDIVGQAIPPEQLEEEARFADFADVMSNPDEMLNMEEEPQDGQPPPEEPPASEQPAQPAPKKLILFTQDELNKWNAEHGLPLYKNNPTTTSEIVNIAVANGYVEAASENAKKINESGEDFAVDTFATEGMKIRRAELDIAADKIRREIIAGQESGTDVSAQEEQLADNRIEASGITKAIAKSGSKSGLNLQQFQMGKDPDDLSVTMRKANDVKVPLTPEEIKKLEEITGEIDLVKTKIDIQKEKEGASAVDEATQAELDAIKRAKVMKKIGELIKKRRAQFIEQHRDVKEISERDVDAEMAALKLELQHVTGELAKVDSVYDILTQLNTGEFYSKVKQELRAKSDNEITLESVLSTLKAERTKQIEEALAPQKATDQREATLQKLEAALLEEEKQVREQYRNIPIKTAKDADSLIDAFKLRISQRRREKGLSDRLAERIETLSTGAFKSKYTPSKLKSGNEITLEAMVSVYDTEISRQIREATKELRARENAIKRDTPLAPEELGNLKMRLRESLNNEGLNGKNARDINALCRDYILRGEEDVETVISKVREDLYDMVDEFDIAASFGGLVKDQAVPKSEMQERIAEFKKESSAISRMISAFNGIFQPSVPVEKRSKKLDDLMFQIDVMRKESRSREADERAKQRIDERYDAVKREIEGNYRKWSGNPSIPSQELIAAQARLSDIAGIRNAMDAITELNDEINSGAFKQKLPKQKIISDELMALHIERNKLRSARDRIIALKTESRFKYWTNQVLNTFSVATLNGDIGIIMRQGGLAASDPKLMFKVGKESLSAFLTKQGPEKLQAIIENDEAYTEAVKYMGPFKDQHNSMNGREIVISEHFIERLPVIGGFYKKSGDANVQGHNYIKMAAFKTAWSNKDVWNGLSEQEKYDFGTLIGNASGSITTYKEANGDVSKTWEKNLSGARPFLDNFLLSSGWAGSRFSSLFSVANPRVLKSSFLRKNNLKRWAWFVGLRMAISYMWALVDDDAEIGTDPAKSDFGKIVQRLPNGQQRVYDPWAGELQAVRLLVTMGMSFKAGKKQTAVDETFRFLRGKVRPVWTTTGQIIRGKNFYGEKTNRGRLLVEGMTPLYMQTAYEAIENDTGAPDLIAATLMDVIGIGSYIRGKPNTGQAL